MRLALIFLTILAFQLGSYAVVNQNTWKRVVLIKTEWVATDTTYQIAPFWIDIWRRADSPEHKLRLS